MNLYSLVIQMPPPVVALVASLAICFLGYRLRMVGIFISGALLGYVLGRGFAIRFFSAPVPLVTGIVVGLLFGIACVAVHKAGIFLLCGACGDLFVSTLLPYVTLPVWVTILLHLFVFVALGALGLKFTKPLIVLATGLAGASNVIAGLIQMGLQFPSPRAQAFCLLALAGFGIFVQFSTEWK